MVAVTWASGCGGVGLVASTDLFPSLSLSLSLSFPLNQASMGLIVWWSSWVCCGFDVVANVADQGGAEVVYRCVVVVLLMVDWGAAVDLGGGCIVDGGSVGGGFVVEGGSVGSGVVDGGLMGCGVVDGGLVGGDWKVLGGLVGGCVVDGWVD